MTQRLLTWDPNFINANIDANIDTNIDMTRINLINVNLNPLFCPPNDDLLLFDLKEPKQTKIIYVSSSHMENFTKELLDKYDFDIERLELNYSNILGILDLAKFNTLTYLDCSFNKITNIINIPSTLKYLNTSFNHLKHLDLKCATNLKHLNCGNNFIKTIANIPSTIKCLFANENLLSNQLNLEHCINLEKLNIDLNKLELLHVPHSVEFLWVYDNDIQIIVGIQNCSKLKVFECSNNTNFTNWNNLPDNLETLVCMKCSISKFNKLPTGLCELYCSYNSITNLNNLPPNLVKLVCENVNITNLDNLPCGLKILICSRGWPITHEKYFNNLDNLPESLEELDCANCVKITQLDNLPRGLIKLNCVGTRVTNFYCLPETIKELEIRPDDESELKLCLLPKSLVHLCLHSSHPCKNLKMDDYVKQHLKKVSLSSINTCDVEIIKDMNEFGISVVKYDHRLYID